MTEATRTVIGEAKMGLGPETINPALLTYPMNRIEYEKYAADIPFTHIQREVNNYEKEQMQMLRCLSGNEKKYDEDISGEDKCANFSWWSVHLDDSARDIVTHKKEELWEIDEFFHGMYEYGDYRLILSLDRMMEVYQESCIYGAVPVVQILGTFQYKREWMHAFVITPNNDLTFQNHPFAAFLGFDGRLAWNPNVPLKAKMDTYEWNAFSTVKWDNSDFWRDDNGYKRKWNHLAFAFHLDPLRGQELNFKNHDVMEENWQCREI